MTTWNLLTTHLQLLICSFFSLKKINLFIYLILLIFFHFVSGTELHGAPAYLPKKPIIVGRLVLFSTFFSLLFQLYFFLLLCTAFLFSSFYLFCFFTSVSPPTHVAFFFCQLPLYLLTFPCECVRWFLDCPYDICFLSHFYSSF